MTKYSRNHFVGVLKVGKRKCFYKAFQNKQDFQKELRGYWIVSKYYPVPELLFTKKIEGRYLLVFAYEESIKRNQGLLADLLTREKVVGKKFDKIFDLYREAFQNTLHKNSGESSDIFFRDRLKTRFEKYYSPQFQKKKHIFKLNKHKVSIRLAGVKSKLDTFFKKRNSFWCVISQCDPNELNIANKPLIFDYLGGGSVPLMAELAMVFWYQVVQASYLNPSYDLEAFKNHPNLILNKNRVKIVSDLHINYRPQKTRILYLKKYIEEVINPVFESVPEQIDWYQEFKSFLALRILCVFNISEMDEKDMLLSLGYLGISFDRTDIRRPIDLLTLIQ